MVGQPALRVLAAFLVTGLAFAQEVIRVGEPAPSSANPPAAAVAPNSYIVKFAPGTARNERATAAFFAGVTVRHNYSGVDAIAVTTADANALATLRQHARVIGIVPDSIVRAGAKG